jgi:hypothetical protein
LIAGWTSMGDEPPDGLLMRVNPGWRRGLAESRSEAKGPICCGRSCRIRAGGYVVVGFTGSEGKGSLDGWNPAFRG